MILFTTLRDATRAATSSIAHSALASRALAVAGTAGLALSLAAAPAAASARPHHKGAQQSAHASARTTSRTSSHKSKTARRREESRHRAARAASRRHDRHQAAPADDEVADAPPPLVIPQFALPDLAIAAQTVPAGRSLGGFGGAAETAMVPASAAPRTLAALTRSAASLLDALVARARSQLGTRYVFGGSEPGAGLDCSSFARYTMEALGIRLPRTANQQAQIGRPIPRDANQLRPGDLLTFGTASHVSHVGIYLGAGRFIHASVKHGEVIETTIDRNRSLFRRWTGARRLLAAVDDSAADDQLTHGG